MWERLCLYMKEEWLVGAASVMRDADTEHISATGLLNVILASLSLSLLSL
jgi:hypothetical protein